MNKSITKIHCPDDSIWVELDEAQIFPKDPGMGTPVLVCLAAKKGQPSATGTWNCVTSEGEVDGIALEDYQADWLREIESEVEEWMEAHGC